MLLAAGYAGVFIWYAPGYYSDDFLVFFYIQECLSTLSFPGLTTPFYLGLRPGFVLFLSLLHSISADPVFTKMFLLFSVLLLLFFSYRIIILAGKLYGFVPSGMILFTGLLFITFHPDTLYSVFWISNGNELLMTLFYAGSIYSLLLMMQKGKPIYLLLCLLLYVISVSMKQTGLHLPFLAALFLSVYTPGDRRESQKSTVYILTAAGILISAASIWLHASSQYAGILDSIDLWKKPFAVAGTLLYVLNPEAGSRLYGYFLINKLYAVLAAVPVTAAAVWYIYRKRLRAGKIIFWLAVLALIFFPRMMAPGGDRVNMIQVFWAGIAGILLVSFYRKGKAAVLLLYIFAIVSSVQYSAKAAEGFRERKEVLQQMNHELADLSGGKPEEYLLVTPPDTWMYPYLYGYYAAGKFSRYPFTILPVSANTADLTGIYNKQQSVIEAIRSGDTLRLRYTDAASYFTYNPADSVGGRANYLSAVRHPGERGYNEISVLLRGIYSTMPVMFFDGAKWRRVSNQ